MDTHKVCLLGGFGVGKTSLVSRFVYDLFPHNRLINIGLKVDSKRVEIDGHGPARLAIWDLAGTDTPADLFLKHLAGASGYLLVADGTRVGTLAQALELRRSVTARYNDLPCVAVINKCDLGDHLEGGEVSTDPSEPDVDWLRCSALSSEGVSEAFGALVRKILASA